VGTKNPSDLLRRVYDIFELQHIIFSTPEFRNENDDDVIEPDTYLINLNAKIEFFE